MLLKEWMNGISNAEYFWCFSDVARLLGDSKLPSLKSLPVSDSRKVIFSKADLTEEELNLPVEQGNQFFHARPIFETQAEEIFYSANHQDMLRASLP